MQWSYPECYFATWPAPVLLSFSSLIVVFQGKHYETSIASNFLSLVDWVTLLWFTTTDNQIGNKILVDGSKG